MIGDGSERLLSFDRPSYSLRAALLEAVALQPPLAGVAVETSVAPVSAAATIRASPGRPASFADVVDRVKPAVVSVKVKLADADPDDDEDSDGIPGILGYPEEQPVLPFSSATFSMPDNNGGADRSKRSAAPSFLPGSRVGLLHFGRRLYRHQQPCRRSCLRGDRHNGRGPSRCRPR